MTARGVSQDELLAWIEADADEAALADIGARLAQDPELEAWARGARGDRERLSVLGARDAREAPAGLWREALAESERRALLIEREVEPERGPFRLRVTPVRVGIAAAVLIVASLGSIAPLVIGPGGGSGGGAPVAAGDEQQGVGAMEAEAPHFALNDEVRESRSLADSLPARRAPEATMASLSRDWAADPNGLVAGRALAGLGFGGGDVMTARRRELPNAFPESWGMSSERARRLAGEGRLVVRVRTGDVDAYIDRLRGAMGRRATLEDTGFVADANGVGSPAEVVVRAPSGRLERALRVCAIEASELDLTAAPATGRPGVWAQEALWWAGSDDESSVRVLVEPM